MLSIEGWRGCAHTIALARCGAVALAAACGVDSRDLRAAPGNGAAGSGELAGAAGQAGESPAGGSGGQGGGAGAGSGGQAGGGAGLDAGGTGGAAMPMLAPCADGFLTEGSATGATRNAAGEVTLSCVSGVADDVTFHWIAPAADYYAFDTRGSSFDTALGLLTPSCDRELSCNDDALEPQSEILRAFAEGEEAVIVVDGKSGSFGDVVLNVSPIACPAIDADQQPLPFDSSTLDGTNSHDGACGGAGMREKAFRYRAPSAGLYRFSASSSAMTPSLYVERGPRCGGSLLGCNRGANMSPATVVRRLGAGEVVTLIVDSASNEGEFELDVENLGDGPCPTDRELGSNFGDQVSATLAPGDASVLTGSCAPAQHYLLPNGVTPLPEHSYTLSTSVASVCIVSFETDAPLIVYVLTGLSCDGPELTCQAIEPPGARLDIELGTPEPVSSDYTLVVEAAQPLLGPAAYTLSVSCTID